MEKLSDIGQRIRLLLIKLGIVAFGLGFVLGAIVVGFSFTPYQKNWLLLDKLIEVGVAMTIGG